MADTASAPASQPSPTRRASPPGIENPNPIASTSAHTLDNSSAQTAPIAASPFKAHENTAATSTLPDNLDSVAKHNSDMLGTDNTGLQIASNQDGAMSPTMSASLQAATAGLNEEDAKLLASLAEGNGLLNHLSNLAAQNASSDDLINAYAGGLMLDPSSSGLPSNGSAFDAAALQGAVDLNEALTRQDMDWDDEAFDDLEPEDEDGEDQGPIQAYAKLEFPGFSYYIQTLDVTIGRRPGQLQPNQRPGALPPQLPNAASGLSQAHITSESKTEGDVDVDLGPLKSISRLHARIFYYTGPIHPPNSAFLNGTPAHSRASSGNGAAPYRITSPTALSRVNGAHLSGAEAAAQDPYNMMGASAGTDPEQGEGQFVLMVVGRNGAFVDDVWVEKGGLVVLGKRTKIQIAERVFYFVLPPPPGAAAYSIDGDSQRAHDSESDSLSELSSDDQADEDDEDEDEEEEAASSSSVSSDESGDDDYEGQEDDERDAAAAPPDAETAEQGTTKGRRRSSAAGTKSKPDPANDKPKRRLVLKPKSKVGKAAAGAAAEGSDDPIEEQMDDRTADKAKSQTKAQGKGKAATKTTAAALANRAAGKGKGKGAGRGKMPTKGPVPDTRPDGDDSDSLGTPNGGERSSDEEEDDGITTPPPPSNARGGASGKRPAKGVKGLKGAKNTKASKANKADDAAQGSDEAATAGSPVKKESPTPSWAMGAGVAGRKRKRGEAVADEEPALKVGTPIGIEALDAAKRAKAAKARADASSRAASASPKKDKATASAPTLPTPSPIVAADVADDDVIMLDVKPAPAKPASSATTVTATKPAAATSAPTLPAPAPAAAAAASTTATPASTTPAGATTGAAAKGEQKGTDTTTPASTTAAKAKPAKPKTTKPKKKKGAAAEETGPTPPGVPGPPGSMVPGGVMGNPPMPMGTFPGSFGAQNMYPPSMPYDPNSASAASAIIAAANAVSGSMPGYGQPSAQALPHAVGQMASPLPMIPSAAAGRGPGMSGVNAGAAPGAYSGMPMPPSMTSLPAPTSTPASTQSGSDPSTWPTTASIIASAASLANAQAKQNQQKVAGTPAGGSTPTNTTASATKTTPTPAPAAAKPPPGPEDKPDLSNIELISQALRSEHCGKKGGKLTLQEVYEWIANRWIWFKRNGRHTGRDWQSSIRHAIGSSRDFTRIPRRSDEPGKGIFYTMSDSKLAEQHRANLAKQKEEAAKAAAAGPAAPAGAAGIAGTALPGVTTAGGTLPQSAVTANSATAAAAGAAAAGTPGSLPAIRIPLIIGTPPSSATASATDKPKAVPGTIESLLETPPIVHHDGKLYLSPQVFGHLNAGQLAQIEGLGAQQALQVLQAYLVTHLKERMRLQQVAAQKKDTTPATGKATPATSTAAAKPATPSAGAATTKPTPSPSPAPAVKANVPGTNGNASAVKSAAPAVSTATATTVPAATTALPRPPGSATSLHPMTTLPKPVLPAPIKPSIPTSSQSAAASAKPSIPTAASSAPQLAKPATTPAAPSVSPVAPPKAPVLPSTPLRTSVPTAAATAPKVSTPAPAAAASITSPTKPSTGTGTGTGTSAAVPSPQKAAATPAKTTTPAPTAGTPAASTAAAAASSSSTPSVAAGNGAGKAAASSAAGSATGSSNAAGSGLTAGDSDDPLSALSALAAHPEAAALIALLRKQQQESGASGGKQLAKLTPGQLQLLQMANKLAAQQGKKGGTGKKKKKASTGTGTREATATPGPSGQESSPAPPGPSPSPGPKAG